MLSKMLNAEIAILATFSSQNFLLLVAFFLAQIDEKNLHYDLFGINAFLPHRFYKFYM